jgi:hypothetical protein
MPPTSRAPGDKSTHVERPGGSSYTTDVERQIASAISAFGSVVAPRLRAEVGSPEDNLRGPLEVLIRRVGEALGLRVLTHGEASLPELSVRPDYIVDVAEARVGYIELKAPGKGVPGAWSGASQGSDHSHMVRPRAATVRVASRAAQRLPWAVRVNPIMRRVAIAVLRRVAMTGAADPARSRCASSCMVTSRTW